MEIFTCKIKRVQRVNIIPNSSTSIDVVLRGVNLDNLVQEINIALHNKSLMGVKGNELLQVQVVKKHGV